jgi:hypothetical protein
MPSTEASFLTIRVAEIATAQPITLNSPDSLCRKPPRSANECHSSGGDLLLTADDVARRLNVSKVWVWDPP